ncbi:MAG: thioredoxin fold domain-containing protein [Gammaproteobacteria bacterium]|nr:thioredoxin fold domain-containing protein [Gammaproteobacteria bacterium]
MHASRNMTFLRLLIIQLILLLAPVYCAPAFATVTTEDVFDDQPLSDDLIMPDWFKVSFLDLQEDLDEAVGNGKQGLIVYFGQKRCAYCKAHLENNWGQKDILAYTQKHFDVIHINILGQKEVTGMDGNDYTEKEFAIKYETNFTPSLAFFNRDGKLVLRLRGYRPPYQFRAALEYVADAHYHQEPFGEYMARAEEAFSFGKDALNVHDAFLPPPYALDRSRFPADRPLLVAFERRNCHACDVLHAEPLSDPRINQLLQQLDVVQLDMRGDTPVLTPGGQKITARQWAEQLQLDYAPTLILFDERGKEIIRIDSVVWFYRLQNVLKYVNNKGYRQFPTFQAWRQHHQE